MKASHLTNSIISILNEDMYSKYTIQQLYDKLGKEEFFDYLTKTCQKAINLVAPGKKFELVIHTNVYPVIFKYLSEIIVKNAPTITEIFNFKLHSISRPSGGVILSFNYSIVVTEEGGTPLDMASSFNVILDDPSFVGLSELLRKEVNHVYDMSSLVKMREKYNL